MSFLKNNKFIFFVFAAVFSATSQLFCPEEGLGSINFKNLFAEDSEWRNINYSNTTMPFTPELYIAIVNQKFTVDGHESDQEGIMKNFISGLVACHLFARQLKNYGQNQRYKYAEIFKQMDIVCCMIVRRLKLKIKYEGDSFQVKKAVQDFGKAYYLAFGQIKNFINEFTKAEHDIDAYFSIPKDALFSFVRILDNYCYISDHFKENQEMMAARTINFINPAFGDPQMESGEDDPKIKEKIHDLLILINHKGDTFLAGDARTSYSEKFITIYNKLMTQFPRGQLAQMLEESPRLSASATQPTLETTPADDLETSLVMPQRSTEVFFDKNVWIGVKTTTRLLK